MQERLRIVVADDEPVMRLYLRRILPRIGHQVVGEAENGRELIALCRELQPDLVITDICMPECDGISASEAIYREQAIPVILISAYHDRELIERAETDHIMAYLVKPVRQSQLEPAIPLSMIRFRQLEAARRALGEAQGELPRGSVDGLSDT